ncbi:MAG: DUF992 domain-containing protein [Alphaproteobacteria bacterium]|jgi:hypothetical protein|nr:DUF992 domain-containing protein [Alphaproteobacteria bacterium]
MKASKRIASVGPAFAVVALLLASAPATAEVGINIGVLTCKTIKGTRSNFLIHSSVEMNCTFTTPSGAEKYRAKSGIAIGIDLNWNRVEEISFAVLSGAIEAGIGKYALAGRYYGGKASVTAGVGAGAAGLIGGGSKNFSLQPLGLETSTGLGLSGGLGYLDLAPDPSAK